MQDFSTLSRRKKALAVQISSCRAPRPLNLLVESTRIKFLGDGEWLARKHGARRGRQYHEVLLAMDTATGDIRAVELPLAVRVQPRAAGPAGLDLAR